MPEVLPNQTQEIRQQNIQLAEQSEKLKINAEQLKALDKMKSNFFVNISHEFRTPLAAQLASIELLRDGFDTMTTDQQKELVKSLERGALRLFLRAIRRPDLTEAEAAEVVGETKAKARERTLDQRTILIGIPAHDPLFHRTARNIEGIEVAPVGEFNTYDILKQRYLLLTREALDVLKTHGVKSMSRTAGSSRPASAGTPAARSRSGRTPGRP